MTGEPEFQEKFIAFVDILGFEAKVGEAAGGGELQLADLLGFCASLSREEHAKDIESIGPMVCPESLCVERNLNYRVTQISDCAIISAEISPAGVINVLHHVASSVYALMTKGIMVRGYISRGSIYHSDHQVIGPGYLEALHREKEVVAFGLPHDTDSTPFVEIDPAVVSYISRETDACVRVAFKDLSKVDPRGKAVIFPFRQLARIAGENIGNAELCLETMRVGREWIGIFLQRLELQAPAENTEASQKIRYYQDLLQEQLEEFDRIEEALAMSQKPLSQYGLDEDFNVIRLP